MSKEAKRWVVLNYRYGDDHVNDSLSHGVIGLPTAGERKKGTRGSVAFRNATSDNPIYYIIYDVKGRGVVGVGTSLGSCFEGNDQVFSPDPQVPDEKWGLRIHGMTLINRNRTIPCKKFKEMGGAVYKGAANYVDEQVWIDVKNHLIGV